MKTCILCEKPLPSSLDEFGDIVEPVCRDCFFDGKAESNIEENMAIIKSNGPTPGPTLTGRYAAPDPFLQEGEEKEGEGKDEVAK